MQFSRKTLNRFLTTTLSGALLLALHGTTLAAASDSGPRASNLSLQVDTYRGKSEALTPVRLFDARRSEVLPANSKALDAVKNATLVELDRNAVAALLKNRPTSITLALPTQERGTVELELFQADIFAPDFAVSTSSGGATGALQRGLHYRGIVKGDSASFAALSVFDGEIMGTFSTTADGNWVVGKLENGDRSGRHIVYAQSALTAQARKNGEYLCGMDDRAGDRESFANYWGKADKGNTAAPASSGAAVDALLTTKCATEWLEAEHDIFQNRGSVQATINYMTSVFNNSATLYANDGISLRLQQVHVWDTPDPYTSSNTQTLLTQFQNQRAASFTGTIGQLLTFRDVGGGLAAGFSGVCNASRSASMAVSFAEPNFSGVPTFSNTVEIMTHEAGHLLGSRHTHACVWNGNNTAIDSCAGRVEGNCALPGIPSNGGTIMSYCHLQSVGTNFNNGFGAQPSAVIRNQVEGGSCLANCSGGNNGGGPLTRGVAMTNQSAAAGSGLAYTLAVPAGATNLVFTTSGGTGDADLFVRFGSAPTTSTFDCRSDTASNSETCTIASPAAGTYHVLLQAQAAYSGVSISGNYTAGGSGGVQTYSNGTDVAINDNSTVNSPIVVAGRSGNAPANASVTVAIRHTYIQDLKVDLVAPDGTLYTIHNRSGGGTQNINRTLTLNLSSEALNGTWNLRVNDNATRDTGAIDNWSVTF